MASPARARQPARRSAPAAPDRVKLIRAIHAACRQAGLDEDDRRAFQAGVVEGKTSLGDMDAGELRRVLGRLNGQSQPAPAGRPHIGKVRALWWSLYWLGEVDQTDERAIDSFVQRQTGIAALRFLDHRQADAVIEALKAWVARAGVTWPRPAGNALDARRAVYAEIRMRLPAEPMSGLPAGLPARWTAAELDAAIRVVGRRWRAVLGKA